MKASLEDELALQLRAVKLDGLFIRQFPWAQPYGRKFCADFANATCRLLLEVEGGIWRRSGKGAHTGGSAVQRDCEKQNLAVETGWKMLRFTDKMIRDGSAIALVERLVNRP